LARTANKWPMPEGEGSTVMDRKDAMESAHDDAKNESVSSGVESLRLASLSSCIAESHPAVILMVLDVDPIWRWSTLSK
jgi:hypothetical protein